MAIRIDGPGRANGIQGGQPIRRPEGAGSAFSLPAGESAARPPAAVLGAATGLSDVASLLALQGVPNAEEERERRRKAVRRGFDLLDVLEGVRMDLLGGGVPAERLERIVRLLGQRRPSGDDALEALVDDIELRARVELAKFGRFPE